MSNLGDSLGIAGEFAGLTPIRAGCGERTGLPTHAAHINSSSDWTQRKKKEQAQGVTVVLNHTTVGVSVAPCCQESNPAAWSSNY